MVLTCTFRGQFVCSVAHQTNVRSVVSKRKLYNCCSESRIDSQNVVYITDQDLENKFKQLTDDPQAAETDPKNQEEERGLLQEEQIQKIIGMSTADRVLSKLQELFSLQEKEFLLSNLKVQDCESILEQCILRGNFDLAVSIYQDMQVGYGWPVPDLKCLQILVVGLAEGLRVKDASNILQGIGRNGGVSSVEVSFGNIVTSPLCKDVPLAVINPSEGAQQVACSDSRYLFTLYSGVCITATTQPLELGTNVLLDFARGLGLYKRNPVQAVQEIVVQAADGVSRTFRFGTCSSEVAAVEGDEVTIVCAGGNKQKRGILNNSPPGKQIGEVMQVSNHSTGVVCVTERAPARSQQSGQVPSWLLPAVVLFAASDTASSLIDPNLPLIIGMGTVASIGSTLLASNVLWPQLKKIPQNTLAKEQQRQLLLGQHENMAKKLTSIIKEAEDNIRKLAKLSQLRSKMQSVGQQDAYGSRLIQVAEAISTLQHQLKRNIQLVEGYSKVVNMIEIEVEMESDIINQDKGIQKQMQRLLEVEQMAEEWQYQVEAKEELNRILKTYE
eukprot:TRINITY_DN1744_c3_g1_i1.p1 TRINITY_DN1744_c3_g1~~TRINITY_DN1744_c3_g1_i1.p1  ORF type:complete len:569 (-),score=80.38 TRINITY_DN1744_c3_g1_i1:147-1814(-)